MTKKHRSDAFAAIHETMEALHEVGAVNKQTMREFDAACLPPVNVAPTGYGDFLLEIKTQCVTEPNLQQYLAHLNAAPRSTQKPVPKTPENKAP